MLSPNCARGCLYIFMCLCVFCLYVVEMCCNMYVCDSVCQCVMWILIYDYVNLNVTLCMNVYMVEFVLVCVCVCVCVWVGVCVSTINRGHTLTLHNQTEDNIANEDSPWFVDTCKRLQIAYYTLAYKGLFRKKENNMHRVWSSVQRWKVIHKLCVRNFTHKVYHGCQ